jgi:hypothetical protein
VNQWCDCNSCGMRGGRGFSRALEFYIFRREVDVI